MTDSALAGARQWLARLESRWEEPELSPDALRVADPEVRRLIITTLREHLTELPREETGGPSAEPSRSPAQLEVDRAAYDYLVHLAHHFSGEEPKLESPEQVRAFCERIRRSVNLLVGEFKELLSGRKKVQNDWSLYSSSTVDDKGMGTRIFRVSDLHGELGRLLFDWRKTSTDESATIGVRTAIDELKHHQLAMMSAFERCVKEGTLSVLKSVDPETLDQQFLSGTGSPRGGMGSALRQLLPGRGWWLWRLYRRRYAQLVAEDPQWFQARFLPAFRLGYRDYMLAKTPKAESAHQPSMPGGIDA